MRIVPWFWTVIWLLSHWLCLVRLRYTTRIEGPVPQGPVLLCAKHASGLDIPMLADFCYRNRATRPHFQMGSFVGYPVLGFLVPFMQWLGGFPVMRPKEVLRLRHRKGWDRERALQRMAEVNAEAEAVREAVLRSGGVLVVFPEGTRDASQVRPLVSELEVATALRLVGQGIAVSIWPAIFSYGPPRLFGRRLRLEALPAFRVEGQEPGPVLQRIQAIFDARWLPPERVAAPDPEPASSGGAGRAER